MSERTLLKGGIAMDDRQIITMYFARNEAALTATQQKYGEYVMSIAQNILDNVQDAQECLNDTLLKLWNLIPPENPKDLKAYIAKIVRNDALDRYRDRTRQKRGGGQVSVALTEVEDVLQGSDDPMSEADRRALVSLINSFLQTQPERERNVFILRYFYLESVSEIAKAYRLRESHVFMTLSRTRQKLKKAIEKEGYTI